MERHVQAQISERAHDLLRRKARRERRPIKDLVREAVEAYIEDATGPDPLDDLIGSFNIGGDWSQRKDWRDPKAKRGANPRGS